MSFHPKFIALFLGLLQAIEPYPERLSDFFRLIFTHSTGRRALFQGTKKLKMASLKESLRDYHRGLSNNWVNQTPRKVGIFTQISRRRWLPKTFDLKHEEATPQEEASW
jgi:hypothetical protein